LVKSQKKFDKSRAYGVYSLNKLTFNNKKGYVLACATLLKGEDDYDLICLEIVDDNINMSVPWYLMASYAYYVQDNPLLSDSQFDRLARKMLEHWDKIDHMHKHLISVDDLKAGTYLGEYPKRIEGAIESMRSIHGKKSV